ncbi:hypothetical protein EQP59_05130 [Ornithobacterium rhinotracheale]|uniref:Uncharacterized protein n=1 Tax=Ornithobacterium rhinotracheale TaxID=28251 RepID=A0A3R5WZK0_ORNRH|nr:hypothetical protein [Ornithobacterium rhinotracheale]QAR30764.1 hypothetical protein EQP59_05130 [Ornithobacterium rhinotracheale]
MSYKSEKVKENKDKVSYFINEQKEFVSGRLDKVKYTISLEKEDEEIFVKCGNWIDYDGNGNIENIERYIPCEYEKINFEEQKIKQLEEQKMENLKKIL